VKLILLASSGIALREQRRQIPQSKSNRLSLHVRTQPDQAVAEQLPQSSVETVFDISANGYTVQLGAYLSQAVAERFADKIITADSDITADTRARLRIQNIIANGQFRFVIVYGHYQTRQQAQNSAERLKVLNPQLEYWVRTVESMR
jgi:septal ring-binding cell division protein DamX